MDTLDRSTLHSPLARNVEAGSLPLENLDQFVDCRGGDVIT